jgi:hypothetical protein
VGKTSPRPWPRLSAELPEPVRPDACQACASPADLTRWRECDDDDTPGPVVVTLCQPCADRLVERHPRLYVELAPHEPFPGAMPLCGDCRHRDGGQCIHPDLTWHGGPGLHIVAPKPRDIHICSRGRGHGRGCRTIRTWPGPARDCAGRDGGPISTGPAPEPPRPPAQGVLVPELAQPPGHYDRSHA